MFFNFRLICYSVVLLVNTMSKKRQKKSHRITSPTTPANISQQLETALHHHRQGEYQSAETLYRQILQQQPNHPDALHLLGVINAQNNRPQVAVELIQQAIQVDSLNARFYNSLGNVWWGQQQLKKALKCYQQAVALNPELAEAHNGLANVLNAQQQYAQAVASYRQAISLNPNFIEAYHNLGQALTNQGAMHAAIQCYQQLIARHPTNAQAYFAIGLIFKRQNKLIDAADWLQRAINFNPHFAEAHYHLGDVFRKQQRWQLAGEQYQQTLAVQPNHLEAHHNLGVILEKQDKFTAAEACYRKAISLAPTTAAESYAGLAQILKNQGVIADALAHYKSALTIKPNVEIFHNWLYALNLSPEIDLTTQFIEAQKFNEQYAKPLIVQQQPLVNSRKSAKKTLKIGYVSPDFRQHSVAFFIEPILAHHDPEQFEIVCYYNQLQNDQMTRRLKSYVKHWFDCYHLSDQALAEKIRQDNIDILVDLAGHTADNRLLVFARKPAPIQVTYLGYPTTTGLTTIDYRITDHYVDVAGVNDRVSEIPVKLPNSYFCYSPLPDSPPINELPALTQPNITFGSFNNYAKITPQIKALWANLLQQLPHAQLLLKAKSLSDEKTLQQLQAEFAQLGIESQRLIIANYTSSQYEHLTIYHQIDIALDTFPYNGATTTCEALWMGVPVVTLVGEKQASRMGLSILSTVGLNDLIASTPTEYLEISIKLANELNQLQQLRQSLRERMQNSPLMNGAKFTRDLETAYQTLNMNSHR
jgi:protein O-GlcNAc transferase